VASFTPGTALICDSRLIGTGTPSDTLLPT